MEITLFSTKKMRFAKPFESKNNLILFIKRVGERFQSCLKTQTLLDFEKVLRHLMWRGTL